MSRQVRNRAELARLRGKESEEALDSWVEAFADGDRALAEKYALVLSLFREKFTPGAEKYSYLGQFSPATRKAYSTAIIELFEFLARKHKAVVAPHEVTRADAEAYVEWLTNRPFTLEEEKLKDGDEPSRLAIYEIVKEYGKPIGAADVAKLLPASEKRDHPAIDKDGEPEPGKVSMLWLNEELGRMVLHDLLVRSPTLEQIRREHPRAGIDQFFIPEPNGMLVDLWAVFSYTLPKPKPVSRATVALRLAALSSFWDALAEVDGTSKPVLLANPWKLIKKRVSRGAGREKRAAAARQRMDPLLVAKMLVAADEARSLPAKRDRALFRFLALTGARVSEATQLRRGRPAPDEEHKWPGWLDTTNDPPVVVVTRKGEKRMRLPFPPYAMEALIEFQSALKTQSPPPGSQSDSRKAPHYVHPDSPKWRYKLLHDEPDAPLFPPVHFWGANSSSSYQQYKPNLPNTFGGTKFTKGMTRHGVVAILKRIARDAGLTDEQIATVHPHALRHFAATAMAKEGKPLREVQAILGHESITTTEKYLAEEESLVALSGQREVLAYLSRLRDEAGLPPAPAVPAPVPAKPTEPKRPIETYGREVPEREAPSRARPPPRRREIQVEPAPENILPVPPEMPEPSTVEVIEDSSGKLIAIEGEPQPAEVAEVRGGVSAPAPAEVYDAMHESEVEQTAEKKAKKAGRPASKEKPEPIMWRPAKTNDAKQFFAKYYERWPDHYGIGEKSVLPWFAPKSSQPKGDGTMLTVTIEIVDPATGKKKQASTTMAPIPVLAPEQVRAETVMPGGALLDEIETLANSYLDAGDATRYLSLERWFAFLANTTAQLDKAIDYKYSWVAFGAPAVVGESMRAHADEYVMGWLKQNGHTYKQTIGAFAQEAAKIAVPALDDPRAAARFWEQIEPYSYDAVIVGQALPDWFASVDPVHEIYERSPSEYADFETWIADLTGERLTRARKDARAAQQDFAAEEIAARRDRALELLETYYVALDGYEEARRGMVRKEAAGGAAGAEQRIVFGGEVGVAKTYYSMLKKVVGDPEKPAPNTLAALGIPDPNEIEGLGGVKRKDRPKAIVNMFFKKEKEPKLDDPNMLADSELFQKEYLRIDPRAHTISHTDEFKRRFEKKFGLDSECVMRRAARAMWEYWQGAQTKERSTRKKMLRAILLSHLATVYPCAADVEQRQAERLRRKVRESDFKEYLLAMNRKIRARVLGPMAGAEEPEALDAEGQREADQIADAMLAEELEPEIERPPTAEELEIGGVEREESPVAIYALKRGKEKPEPEKPAEAPVEHMRAVIRRRKAATPNGRPEVFVSEPGEKPEQWHRVTDEPPHGARFIPNGERPVVFYSPNARRRGLRYLANARGILPSPFRMIAALAMEPGSRKR